MAEPLSRLMPNADRCLILESRKQPGAVDVSAIFAELEIEARERNIGVGTLVRDILEEHLRARRQRRRIKRFTLRKVNLNDPVVNWTAEEEQYADESMRIFREEDR